MRKTFLKVALVGMLAVGASTSLVSCIDNDEPAGIENVRGAYAELLRAKASVAAAQAEVEKAKAEAIALYGQAAAAQTQAEADRIKAEAAEIQQRVNDAIQQAKIDLADAMLKLGEQKKTYVESFATLYRDQLTKYNDAYVAWTTAQNKLLQYNLNPEAYENAPLSTYEKAVEDAQEDVDGSKAKIEGWKQAIEDFQSNVFVEQYNKYKDLQQQTTDSIKLLQIDLSKVQLDNADLYNAWQDTLALAKELYKADIEIKGYKFNFGELPGLNNGVAAMGNKEIKAGKYKLNQIGDDVENPVDPANAYTQAINSLKSWEAQLNGYMLTDNDKEWVKAQLNQYKTGMPALEKNYTDQLAAWNVAKSAFNTGVPEITKLPEATTVANAVEAYNKSITALNGKVTAYATALKGFNDAKGDMTDADAAAAVAALDAYNTAVSTANTTYNQAVKAAEDTEKATKAALQKTVDQKQTAADRAQTAFNQAMAAYQANPTTANNTAVTNALANLTDAQKALVEAKTAQITGNATAETTALRAKTDAQTTQTAALTAAQQTYEDAIANLGEGAPEVAAAKTALSKAQAEYQTALAAVNAPKGGDIKVDGTQIVLNAALEKQVTESNKKFGTTTPNRDAWNAVKNAFSANVTKINTAATAGKPGDMKAFAATTAAAVDFYSTYDAMESVVVAASNKVYGNNIDGTSRKAQLIALTVEQMNKDIIAWGAKQNPAVDITVAGCPVYYQQFGSFGTLEYAKYFVTVAEQYIATPDIPTTALAEVTKAIEEIEGTYAAKNAEYTAMNEAAEALGDKYGDITKDLTKKLGKLQNMESIYDGVIAAYESAAQNAGVIPDDLEQGDPVTTVAVDNFVKTLNKWIKEEEKTLAGNEKTLAKAQDTLKKAQDGASVYKELIETEIENKKVQMDAAKALLDEYKALLDAAIEYVQTVEIK